MGFTQRRRGDRRQSARSPDGSAGTRGRRSARVRRFTRAGVAAALSILSRHTGPLLSGADRAQVEVETAFRVPDYGRRALDQIIDEAAAAHGVSAHLVRAVVEGESGFDPWAVSRAGAQGLMQLMPATAALMGVNDRMDPRQNVFGGTRYLSQLLDRFDGDVALTLAAYNAGPTKVARYRGIPPYSETRTYVRRIRARLAQTTGALFPLPKPAVDRSARGATVRRARAARARR
jgi:soluble lytic murein transglycosylase-like protein